MPAHAVVQQGEGEVAAAAAVGLAPARQPATAAAGLLRPAVGMYLLLGEPGGRDVLGEVQFGDRVEARGRAGASCRHLGQRTLEELLGSRGQLRGGASNQRQRQNQSCVWGARGLCERAHDQRPSLWGREGACMLLSPDARIVGYSRGSGDGD